MTEGLHHPLTDAARNLRRRSTPSERLLWEHLRDRRFRGLKFRRQQPIGTRFVLDFYCSELHLAIEVDGPIHAEQPTHDADRQRALEASGITIVRISVAQLSGDIEALLSAVIPPPPTPTPPLRLRGEG